MIKRLAVLVFLVLISGLVLTACGGGKEGVESGPPVTMQAFEGSGFSVQYPQEWKESSIDMMGLTMAFFGLEEMGVESLQNLDFTQAVQEDPMVVIMSVPAELAGDMGFEDIDATMDEFDDTLPEEGAEILQQGETTLGGATGKIVVAKGNVPDVGDVGVHLAAVKRDDGSAVVFMGITPAENRDQNLDIFEFMHNSFAFTD